MFDKNNFFATISVGRLCSFEFLHYLVLFLLSFLIFLKTQRWQANAINAPGTFAGEPK